MYSSDLLTGTEWNAAHVQELFRLATDVKAHPDRYKSALAGRFLAMIFEKPSLRTRVTFEVGIASMGGTAIYLDHADTHLGDRESIPDVGAVPLALGARNCRARIFAGRARSSGGACDRSGDQRALGCLPSVPDAVRFLHDRGKIRLCARLETCLRRRRQQRLPFADGRRSARRRARAHRDAGRATSRTRTSSRRRGAMRPQRRARSNYSARRRKPSRARKPFTRTSGPAWARKARPMRAPPFSRRTR